MTTVLNIEEAGRDEALIDRAIRTLEVERDGIAALAAALDGDLRNSFVAAVNAIGSARGRAIVSGIGKSGHVGRKIAATLASTGTPAFFLHPSEASHGDLGMVTASDVLLVLSWSGESPELKDLLDYSRRFTVPLVAMTSRPASALGQAADIVLPLPGVEEACPHGLAPTTSTTMQLVLGDALSLALLEWRGFTVEDFRSIHPGGQLGAQLKFVRDLMHTGPRVPLTIAGTPMSEALVIMTEKSFGCLGIVDDAGQLIGVVTDGDLRRNMGAELLSTRAGDIMTRKPKTVPPNMLAAKALELLNASAITSLFVLEDRRPIGVVHIHDFLRAGIV